MLRGIILSLCLIPVLAQAEMICLEGPSYTAKKCHYVDPNVEVFRSTTPKATVIDNTPPASILPKTIISNNTRTTPQKRLNHTINVPRQTRPVQTIAQASMRNLGHRNSYPAEQVIRQRAQAMEARFLKQQNITSLSKLENYSLK